MADLRTHWETSPARWPRAFSHSCLGLFLSKEEKKKEYGGSGGRQESEVSAMLNMLSKVRVVFPFNR